jgi:hypothetical protein
MFRYFDPYSFLRCYSAFEKSCLPRADRWPMEARRFLVPFRVREEKTESARQHLRSNSFAISFARWRTIHIRKSTRGFVELGCTPSHLTERQMWPRRKMRSPNMASAHVQDQLKRSRSRQSLQLARDLRAKQMARFHAHISTEPKWLAFAASTAASASRR